MCYIFGSFVYNKVLDEGESFCSLGWEQFFSREETFFLLGGNRFPSGCVRDAFGMGLFRTGKSKGLVLHLKRTPFTWQKDSFWTAKGLVLKGKRSPFLSVEC